MHMLGREEIAYTQFVGLAQTDQARVGSTLPLGSQATIYARDTDRYQERTNVRQESKDDPGIFQAPASTRYEQQMAEVAALARANRCSA